VEDRLIDLTQVERGRRALMWDGVVRDTFPGISLNVRLPVPQRGSISRIRMGDGEMFAIESGPVEVRYRPSGAVRGAAFYISLMVQSRGSTLVSQGGRHCYLNEGDACLVDEAGAFQLAGEDSSGILFLRVPRASALSRYPQIEGLFATALPGSEPGCRLLTQTLLHMMRIAGPLAELQRSAMLNAAIHILGVAEPFGAVPEATSWRVRRALDFIETNLSVGGLTAEEVARDQRISRRRLDHLMCATLGHSIASHLWRRRLEQAAADLRDSHKSARSVAQIAFANGFEDAAHFTRAFKRKYAVTPGQWRLN
jgi:AraC-like DNA-binding protein